MHEKQQSSRRSWALCRDMNMWRIGVSKKATHKLITQVWDREAMAEDWKNAVIIISIYFNFICAA